MQSGFSDMVKTWCLQQKTRGYQNMLVFLLRSLLSKSYPKIKETLQQ